MKTIFILLLSIFFGMGLWYLIFIFITANVNVMEWHWITRAVYLFLGMAATHGIFKGLTEN